MMVKSRTPIGTPIHTKGNKGSVQIFIQFRGGDTHAETEISFHLASYIHVMIDELFSRIYAFHSLCVRVVSCCCKEDIFYLWCMVCSTSARESTDMQHIYGHGRQLTKQLQNTLKCVGYHHQQDIVF